MIERTTRHFGYDIPTRLMNMTGAGPESFEAISAAHTSALESFVPIQSNHSVLEIGCGIGRDAIPLTKRLSAEGTYVGVDIIGESIQWCNENIGKRHPNFRFIHLDIADALHNPNGYLETKSVKFDVADHSVDRIILWSVFTHMKIEDIAHYLREFARVLKVDGRIFATWFVVSEDILASAQKVNLTPHNLKFEFEVQPGCYVNDLASPMGAVAYSEAVLRRTIRACGLSIMGGIHPGMWSGFFKNPKGGQDMTVLRPATIMDRICAKVKAQALLQRFGTR